MTGPVGPAAPGTRGTPINHAADVELFKEGETIAQGSNNVDKMIESFIFDMANSFYLIEFR